MEVNLPSEFIGWQAQFFSIKFRVCDLEAAAEQQRERGKFAQSLIETFLLHEK
jgi:hypothetical protein